MRPRRASSRLARRAVASEVPSAVVIWAWMGSLSPGWRPGRCRCSPCDPCPDDTSPGRGYLGSPSIRAGECLDDVQPMGPVAGVAPLPPGAAEVFDLDPGG